MTRTRVEFRCNEEERETIERRSRYHSLSMSEYLRRLVAAEEREELKSRIYPQQIVRTITKG